MTEKRDCVPVGSVPVELRGSELHALLNRANAITYVEIPDSALPDMIHTVFASSAIEGILGYTVEEWTASPGMWEKRLHPEDRDRVLAETERSRSSLEPLSVDYRILARDGRVVWLHDESGPVFDETGRVGSFAGVATDVTEQRAAEEALRESESRLAEAQGIAHVGSWTGDPVGRTAVWSDETCRIYGAEPGPQERPLEDLTRIIHPDDRVLMGGWVEAILAGEAPPGIEFRITRPDGEERVVQGEGRAIFDEAGRPVRLMGTVRDVTELNVAQKVLREEEAKFRALFESAVEAIVVVSADGTIRMANARSEEMLGYERDELLGQPLDALVPEARREEHRQQVSRYMKEPRQRAKEDLMAMDLDLQVRRRDGSCFPAEIGLSNIDTDEGALTMASIVDITERRRAEEELRESEERYRLLFESNPHPMWVFDPETLAFLEVNETAIRQYGYSREEFMSMTIVDIRPPEDVPKLHEYLAHREDSQIRAGIWRHMKKDGAVFDVEIVSHDLFPGGPPARLVMATDVTDREQAEEELRASLDLLRKTDAQRRELLSRLVVAQEDERKSIADDIHDDTIQVMAAAAMRLGALRGSVKDPALLERMGRLEETVEAAITRLRHLVFDLRPRALDEGGLAAALRKSLHEVLGERVEIRFADRLKHDPGKETLATLYRIAKEALTNIRKHADARRVDVLLEERDGGVACRIRDHGKGFVVGAEHSPKSGIGLPSMRERAEMLGGWLNVESSPGSGTTVEFWLPDLIQDETGDVASG